jgi:hypothetical protein
MKNNRGGLLRKNRWMFMLCLISLCLLLSGCGGSGQKNIVQVDNVSTASNVSITNGVWDWQQYVQQDSFPSGYSGAFWVMFSFSNILHDGTTHIKANIYIVSGGELIAEENKEANLTDSSDNKLWWGNSFDISSYTDGNYSVIVDVVDLISGTSASLNTTFRIGGIQ